jgi:hypothetical protein
MSTFEFLGLLSLVTPGRTRARPIGAGPTELTSPCALDDVAQKRSLWCPDYDRCLDTACERGWRSWSCELCARFPSYDPARAA